MVGKWRLRIGLTRACTRQSRLSRTVLAHGPRQTTLQVNPTLDVQEGSVRLALDVWLNEVDEFPSLGGSSRDEHVKAIQGDDYRMSFLGIYLDRLADRYGEVSDTENAFFYGEGLDALIQCLGEARHGADSLTEEWATYEGTPPGVGAQRAHLHELIDLLLEAAARARSTGRQILFFGD